MSKRTWTDEKLIEMMNVSTSIYNLCKNLGLCGAGKSYTTVIRKIKELNLDCSKFEYNKNKHIKNLIKRNTISLKDILVENSNYNSYLLKNRLLKNNMIENKCKSCNLQSIWNNKEIRLHLEHINGNHQDNRIENLCLLCPNCHSQTATYCGKNKKYRRRDLNSHAEALPLEGSVTTNFTTTTKQKIIKKRFNNCKTCNKQISHTAQFCKNHALHKQKINWPSNEELQKLIWSISSLQLSKQLGVSDKAIEKRCKKFNIPKPPRGHWEKIYHKYSHPDLNRDGVSPEDS